MQLGRFVSFTLVLVVGGLLQLWVLAIVVYADQEPTTQGSISYIELLGDGGLFFFATSVWVGSAITLVDSKPIEVGNKDFNWTLVSFIFVFLNAVAFYVAVMSSGGFANPIPFKNYIWLQIGFSVLALAYWLYSGVRTGLFVKNK